CGYPPPRPGPSTRLRSRRNGRNLRRAQADAARARGPDDLAVLSRRRARLHASQGAGRQSCSHSDRLTTARCISRRLPIVTASARVGMKNMGKKTAAKTRSTKERRYSDILYEVRDQVAWATINRPRVLNAFREQTLDELIDALKSTREDPSIACAVVTGAGDKAFSAGGDFYAMKRLNWVNAAMWNDRMLGLANTIRGLPIPVIAMVNGWGMGRGWGMGGGRELALWCDLVIGSDNAVLGKPGARVGACPTVGATQSLPRIIGERLAREMIFCARRFTGQEAVAIGLINKCVP